MTGTSLEQHQEGYRLPVAAPPHNEGKTVAGWTFMAIVTLGVLVSCVGLVIDNQTVMWIAGPAVIVVGFIVGLVLRRSGKGQPAAPAAPARDWYEAEETTTGDDGAAARGRAE
ncbi:MAG: HGxxPAAW family protein [Actinomycetaceae bacterium]